MRIALSLIIFLLSISSGTVHACAMIMEVPEEDGAKDPGLLAALMDEIDAETPPEVTNDAGKKDKQPDSNDTAGEKKTIQTQS